MTLVAAQVNRPTQTVPIAIIAQLITLVVKPLAVEPMVTLVDQVILFQVVAPVNILGIALSITLDVTLVDQDTTVPVAALVAKVPEVTLILRILETHSHGCSFL
jgi:hypothetical protein